MDLRESQAVEAQAHHQQIDHPTALSQNAPYVIPTLPEVTTTVPVNNQVWSAHHPALHNLCYSRTQLPKFYLSQFTRASVTGLSPDDGDTSSDDPKDVERNGVCLTSWLLHVAVSFNLAECSALYAHGQK